MQLLQNEEVIVSSNGDKIILTNQRIHQEDKQWGRSYQLTIFLGNISSIEMLYKSNPVFLVLAAIGFVFAIMYNSPYDSGVRSGSFIFALVLLILWFFSKSRVVTIASNGGAKLNFRVEGMNSEAVDGFIDKVLEAKGNRTQLFQIVQH